MLVTLTITLYCVLVELIPLDLTQTYRASCLTIVLCMADTQWKAVVIVTSVALQTMMEQVLVMRMMMSHLHSDMPVTYLVSY